MVLCLLAVLAASIAAGQRERRELMERFRAEQDKLAHDAGETVARRVATVDRDLRLVADLVRRAQQHDPQPTPAREAALIGIFDALATAVAHYRTIGLFGPKMNGPIFALDPAEDHVEAGPALAAASDRLARRTPGDNWEIAVDFLQVGRRRFYLVARPMAAGVVVISVDADLMFTDALLPTPAHERILVVEPSAAFWIACNIDSTCRGLGAGELPPELRARQPPPDPVAPAAVLALPARHVLWTARRAKTAVGDFLVAVVASTDDVEQLQSAALRRSLITAGCAVAVMLFFGALILREQRRSSTLATRLRAAQELAQVRERSDKILENAPLGIVGISRDGRVVFANRFLRRRLGASAESAADAGTAVPPVLAGWLADVREAVGRAFAVGQTVTFQGTDVPTSVHAMRDIEAHVVPLSNPIEGVDALVLIQDLSDFRALQRQLIRAEKLITVGALSAGIAHEVGTPLMVIRGRAEHLLEAAPGAPASRDLAAIIDQIDAITGTIRQVLDFAHPQRIEAQPADAAAVAARAADLLAWRFDRRRLTCSIVAAPATPKVRADPQQLTQVFLNLLSNAADASPDGASIRIALRAEEAAPARFVRIEIEDHGQGIAPENLSAVFDPYFTTKPVGEGAGLGLTVVAHIVRSHGGDVALRSTVGVGTTAAVLWPAAA